MPWSNLTGTASLIGPRMTRWSRPSRMKDRATARLSPSSSIMIRPSAIEPVLVLPGKAPPDVLAEVGGRGNADKAGHAIGSLECHIEHDPATHAGADEDLRALGQAIENGERIPGPVTDGPVLEASARLAVAAIVETHEGTAAAAAPLVEPCRLRPGHVRGVAAEKHHARLGTINGGIGDPVTVFEVEPSRICFRHGLYHGCFVAG